MKRTVISVVFALASSFALAQNASITVWPKGVPPQNAPQKPDFGNHYLAIYHRDKDGRVEVHQNKADVMVIQSGTATLVTGGTVIDPVPTGPNEIQGSRIEGGATQIVGPGDVIEIPAGVPHQFFLRPGTQITYLLVKIIKS